MYTNTDTSSNEYSNYCEYLAALNLAKQEYNQSKTNDAEYYLSDDEGEPLCTDTSVAGNYPNSQNNCQQYPIPPYSYNNVNKFLNTEQNAYKWGSLCNPPLGVQNFCYNKQAYCPKKCTPNGIKDFENYQNGDKYMVNYSSKAPYEYPKNIYNYKYCTYPKKTNYILGYKKPCPKIIVYNNYITKYCQGQKNSVNYGTTQL